MKKTAWLVVWMICALTVFAAPGSGGVDVNGELKQWHKVTITFDGPDVSEGDSYNPFMNYRLNVVFSHAGAGKQYVVPGYFAADGDAGNTSADKGSKWRVHFAPDETGEWTYTVDFRKGSFSAISTKRNTGESAEFMDGATGAFCIERSDKTGRDFRAKGRLQYVGGHYLQFAGSGEYFLKSGPDAPENFLAFVDFDGTFKNDGHKDDLVKTWAAHLTDFQNGDPTWGAGKGKAIIGALNYLASKGLNSVSFLTMNVNGDDRNVFPYVDYDTWDRMDVSRLDQWETVFSHAQQQGLFLHFKLMEVENQGLLDNGAVGANTKLYYREMIARFGHHLALNWNVCEESGEWGHIQVPPQETPERLACAQRIFDQDPYHHHLVIHNGTPFDDLLGPKSKYTGPSVQTNMKDFSHVHAQVLKWRKLSAEAGKKWAVSVDEPGDAQQALVPDASDEGGKIHSDARKNALWGTFLAGGWGVEWYFGYKFPHSDLTCQDYRSRDRFWNYCRYLLEFFASNDIPYWEMENTNALIGNEKNTNDGYCFSKSGDTYLVYLPKVGKEQLDLTGVDGTFRIQWFNPREGGALRAGSVKNVKGGGTVSLGNPPSSLDQDWVVLIR